ncbi:uncharacterized protein LOC115690822 [Syzygium oleosum]|uniref:uncharacterized protein LOC115690822 n=1 Tax=Syzygium oleosum TaxID=219896 RepID=UPI0024BB2637|nr:uncharacterized protein LOC115690822 [Syzygium oleosum]
MASPASPPLKVCPKVLRFLGAVGAGNLSLLKELASQLNDGRGMARTIADAKDDKGHGALHFAAMEGKIEVCKYLLEELKLDVDPKDVEGETPLHLAAGSRHIETTKYLIDRGADSAIPNNDGLTVLHYFAGSGKSNSVTFGNIEMMNFLLSKGVNIDCQSSSGSPLFYSAGCAQLDAAKFLLEHHANPNAETVDRLTPLLASVTIKSLECLKLLIQWGAKVNVTFPGGGTPLHVAAFMGKPDIISCLLEAGADPNVRDENGKPPIQLAAQKGNRAAVEILLPKTSKIKTIPWSVDGIMEHMQAECGDTQEEVGEAEETSKEKDNLLTKQKLSEEEIGKAKENRKEDILLKKEKLSEESEEAKQKAAEAKLRGDAAVERKDYHAALYAYTQARGFDQNDATLLSNRSLCWIRLGEAEHALVDARACRALRPDWPEACYREEVR